MLVLALDTTTRAGSVALVRDDRVLAVASGDPSRTHAERLPTVIIGLLEDQDVALADLDLFAVAAGPGSFTGLRIGIATVQGLAFARGRPVVGVSVLDALARVAGDFNRSGAPFLAAWMDAQRDEVFAALYRAQNPPVLVHGPVSEAPSSVAGRWKDLVNGQPIVVAGDGVVRYREVLAAAFGPACLPVEPLPPLAPIIARIALEEDAAGRSVAPHAVRPIYVRRSDAELARDRKHTTTPAAGPDGK